MQVGTFNAYNKSQWYRGLANSATSTTYPTVAPTTSTPATVDSATPTGNLFAAKCGQGAVQFMFFGSDAENENFHARIYLWRRAMPDKRHTGTALWIPYLAGEVLVTIGTAVGVADAVVAAAGRFADTIAEVGSTWDDNLITVGAGANNVTSILTVITAGFEMFSVTFDVDAGGSAAASANLLYSLVGA